VRSRYRDAALVAGAYLGAVALAQLVGFRMRIPWEYYQLLDRPTLLAHPLGSLCLLHSQPPGLNALLAVVLRVAAVLGVPAETVAKASFTALGLVGALAMGDVTRRLTGSRVVAALAVVAMLADPGHYVHGNVFFYEFPVYVLVTLLLAATVRFLEHGRITWLLLVSGVAAAIALTRTLFHPLWAAAYCAIVVALRARLVPGERRLLTHAVLAGVVLLPVLAAWPLKNLVVYGRFTSASLTGYSLSRAVPGCQSIPLALYVGTGAAPASVLEPVARAVAVCGSGAEAVVASPVKSDGSRNWNHAMFLAAAPGLARCGTAWRFANPRAWLSLAAGQYAMWVRPTFVHPYDGKLLGPADARWIAYATAYEQALFHDLRPTLEPLAPGMFLHREAMIRGRPVPYTVFGFVVLPGLVILAIWRQVRGPRTVRTATEAAALLCLVWPMVGACLTDGQEGNRMRFSTVPALLVVEASLLGELIARRAPPASGDRGS
jgi:hypothetical protein